MDILWAYQILYLKKKMMQIIQIKNHKIFIISDTHGLHGKLEIPKCDIIIHCGDICNDGNIDEIIDFFNWFSKLEIEHKIIVHGNHDLPFELDPELSENLIPDNVIWLNDAFISIEELNILGINGFVNEYEVDDNLKFDILISHYPPKGILDNNFGSSTINKVVEKLKPAYHVFGHDHESFGILYYKNINYINASIFHILHKLN